MYKLAFLENMVNDRFFKKASFISRIADTVNFAANAKVLNDMTNETIASKLNDRNENEVRENDEEPPKSVRLSVLLTGDLKDRIPEEQRQKIVAIARRISEDRKSGKKKRRS